MTETTVSPANRGLSALAPDAAGAVENALGGIAATLTGATSPGSSSTGGPYPVKSNNVQPFDGAGMSTTQIMNALHKLDPGAVADAGAAYTNLGSELDTMAASLTRHAQTLAQNWTGSAARAAMTRFQQLHDQTAALASQAARTGSALTWLGTQVLPKFQQLQTPGTPSTGSALATDATVGGVIGGAVAGVGGVVTGTAIGGLDAILSGSGATAAQAQAQKYISALSNYLVTANSYLPDQIGVANPPPIALSGGPQTKNGTGGSTGSPGTGGPGAGGPGAGGPANGRQAAGSNGAAGGTGGTGSAPGTGGTGAARGTGGTGSAPGAGGIGSAPGTGSAGGTSLSGSGAGGNVAGAGGTASPAPTVSSLQSAAPVPGSTPGAVPAPVSAASSASAGSGAGNLGAGAASPFSPVPMVPGISGSGAGGGSRSGTGAASEAGDPATGMLPGIQGAAGPEVPGLGDGPAGGATPVGEVPGLDGGLTGGATPLPEVPGLNAPGTGAADGAVPAGEAAGSSAVTADGPGAPGSGDSPGRDGLGAMPMAGGGSGQSEKERARSVWAQEDENIWGLPADCVPPVIEGGVA